MLQESSLKEIEKMVKKYGLEPSLRRDISLLGYNAILSGYKDILPKLLGFTYEAFGTIWLRGTCWSVVNAVDIGQKVRALLLKHPERVDKILSDAMVLFIKTRKYFEARKKKNLLAADLLEFLENYRIYSGSLGVYNSLFRAINENDLGISPKLMLRIGQERNQVAGLYPRIESFLQQAVAGIGKELGVDGRLITSALISEVRGCLKSRVFSRQLVLEARRRAEHCFYLYVFKTDAEFITSRPREVEHIFKEFYQIKGDSKDTLKGFTAYPGKAKGRVKILPPDANPLKFEFKAGQIIVAASTNPDFLPIIKKSIAIVTDEGGVLSHAAIISRELKIPCIIGTKIATQVLKDGDRVEVDAVKGIVRKL